MKKILISLFLLYGSFLYGQKLKVHVLNENDQIYLDGILNEQVWKDADSIGNLTMVEPVEGAAPTQKTTIRILADESNIYLGIRCYDSQPSKIISYSKSRDSYMYSEDRIKFVFDTYLDQRSGYIFAVNPEGTRYDALVSDLGEDENSNWDGLWEARTIIDNQGWSVEIRIPIQTISYTSGLKEWGFNIERRIQRNLEIDRWTGIKRDYKISQVMRAGRISNLPDFDIGIGLTSKVSLIADTHKSLAEKAKAKLDYSLDFTQRITSDVSAQLTVNTDFAETEVDSRRTNLTRFPLFYPEKRGFFLEGSDIFEFGVGLGTDVIPFYSRKIGLYNGRKVPIIVGGKLNGKVNNTNFGALVTRTNSVDTLVPAATLGAFRVKQNFSEEYSFGMIGTYGDPVTNNKNWLIGSDFTYQTTRFLGDKNLIAGAWGLYNNNKELVGDNTALGFKLDYPNDLWDISLKMKRIGDAFLPSLGFVPRPGIIYYSLGADFMPRPEWKLIRQFFFESFFRLITDLNNNWESYIIFTAPVHFLLESGDRFEFNIMPRGENLTEDFEIEDGVIIKSGPYHWQRFRLENWKRHLKGQLMGRQHGGLVLSIEANWIRLNYSLMLDLLIVLTFL
ncbi:MAG: carbohydrate binding family 9 domain-containing protein [Chlorobi bacterium]|nr:carbohydrate binding family 9 domain-containing protein [Chlorobiota bacterium]